MTAAGCNEYLLESGLPLVPFQARAASAERARDLMGTTGPSGRLSPDAARRAPMCVEAHQVPCGGAHGRRWRYKQAQRVGVRDGSPKGRDAGSMRSTTARSATPRRTEASATFSRARKSCFRRWLCFGNTRICLVVHYAWFHEGNSAAVAAPNWERHLNEISRSTEPLSITHDPKHPKIDRELTAKVMNLVHCVLVHMTESPKTRHESRACCGLAKGGCHG